MTTTQIIVLTSWPLIGAMSAFIVTWLNNWSNFPEPPTLTLGGLILGTLCGWLTGALAIFVAIFVFFLILLDKVDFGKVVWTPKPRKRN